MNTIAPPGRLKQERDELKSKLDIAEAQIKSLDEDLNAAETRIDELEEEERPGVLEAVEALFAELPRPVGRAYFVVRDCPALQRALLALYNAANP
jgi:chromosome segregation ATPase